MLAGEVRTGSVVIDGLKLTMTGGQLRASLESRMRWHQSEVDRMSQLLTTPGRSIEEARSADRVLADEIGRAQRRLDVLTFIREYILPDEVYQLGEFDLRFADLLPDDDGWDSEGSEFRA
jgi:hypothetical protein